MNSGTLINPDDVELCVVSEHQKSSYEAEDTEAYNFTPQSVGEEPNDDDELEEEEEEEEKSIQDLVPENVLNQFSLAEIQQNMQIV